MQGTCLRNISKIVVVV